MTRPAVIVCGVLLVALAIVTAVGEYVRWRDRRRVREGQGFAPEANEQNFDRLEAELARMA